MKKGDANAAQQNETMVFAAASAETLLRVGSLDRNKLPIGPTGFRRMA